MKKTNLLVLLLLSCTSLLKAQEVFENNYFKITLPPGMVKDVVMAGVIENRENIHWYKSGTNAFKIRIMKTPLSAGQFIYDMEKAFKQMGQTVQSRSFNVNGYIMPGLIEIEKDGDNTLAHVYIMFDNGRNRLKEAGNALVFQFQMTYRIEDEMQRQPINEKSLQSLVLKTSTFDVSFDLNRTKEYSITAPAAGFQYFSSYQPVLVIPGQQFRFGEIKQGAYGTEANPPFADLLKTEFKSFKRLNPKKAELEELTIDGYKAAIFKGTTENKKTDYCLTSFLCLIEVSPKLVRTISYDMKCEWVEIQQPVILPIVKSFTEHKNKK